MMTSYFNLLKYAQTGIASPDMTYYDKLRASTLMGGAVQTLTGIPPLSFKSNGKPLISWSMKGNGQQQGTPTPDNPVMPEFVGVRTNNLAQWEKGGINTSTGADEAYRTAAQGGTCEQLRSFYIPCSGNTTYVFHTNHYPIQTFISYYDADKIYISRSSGITQGENRVFTTPETARYMRVQLAHVTADQAYPAIEENQQYAITLGSTALPYEPYGWAEKITCAGQTVPVYLGQVSTVRRVKKLVLTGDENITLSSADDNRVVALFTIAGMSLKYSEIGYCNILLWKKIYSQNEYNRIVANSSATFFLSLEKSILPEPTINGFIAYLKQQYQNGTPVCLWYVRATSTTGIVNEPLAKIGDYADELSSTDAGVSIPTVKGSNTLTVDTELQPSEMTITYKE